MEHCYLRRALPPFVSTVWSLTQVFTLSDQVKMTLTVSLGVSALMITSHSPQVMMMITFVTRS